MAVTIDSPFKATATITEDRWIEAWRAQGALPDRFNPATHPLWNGLEDRFSTPEEAARALYRLIVARGHDPARWFGIAGREHTWGMNRDSVLWRMDTRSLTNARSIRDPEIMDRAKRVRDPVRDSLYVEYRDVLDSVQDGIYRIEEPGFDYQNAGAVSIYEVVAVWAPSRDGNKPRQYAEFIAGQINALADIMEGQEPMATPYDHIIPGLRDARAMLATKQPGDDGVPRGPYETVALKDKRGLVVHYRGVVTNPGAGLSSLQADAVYHVGKNWATGGEAPIYGSGIMYHIGIDGDGTKWLMRDLERVLWHCGASQNRTAIAVQLPLGDGQSATAAQLKALQEVVDAWIQWSGSARSQVWGHQELSATSCPGTLMSAFVRPYRAGQLGPAPAPVPRDITEDAVPDPWGSPHGKFWVPRVFVNHVNARPWEDTGYVTSGAYGSTSTDGTALIAQDFERARIEYWPDGSITRGLLGLENRALRDELAALKAELAQLRA